MALPTERKFTVFLGSDNAVRFKLRRLNTETKQLTPPDWSEVTSAILQVITADGALDVTEANPRTPVTSVIDLSADDGEIALRLGNVEALQGLSGYHYIRLLIYVGPGDQIHTNLIHEEDPHVNIQLKFVPPPITP